MNSHSRAVGQTQIFVYQLWFYLKTARPTCIINCVKMHILTLVMGGVTNSICKFNLVGRSQVGLRRPN